MQKVYGYAKVHHDIPPMNILHLSGVKTVGIETTRFLLPQEVLDFCLRERVDKINFYFWGFPRKSVKVEKSAKHLKKLFREIKRPMKVAK